MKQKRKPITKFMIFTAIVVVIALLLSIPQVASQVGKVTGWASDKVVSVARTIVGIGLGVLLVTWGIAALSIPILGGALIVIGLTLLAFSLWPLFKPSSSIPQKN